MSKSASIWSRLAIFRLPRSAEKGQHFQTGGKKKTGAKAQPRYNGFRVISDRVITALQCICFKKMLFLELWHNCSLELVSFGGDRTVIYIKMLLYCFHVLLSNLLLFFMLWYKVNFICPMTMIIGLDKSGYQMNIFLISPRKHMLWVLIRSISLRHL